MSRGKTLGIALLLLGALFLATVVAAQQAGDISLEWHLVSGGGAPGASAGSVTLNGSIGQMAIGPASAADISLQAGYWPGVQALQADNTVHLPLILNPTLAAPE